MYYKKFNPKIAHHHWLNYSFCKKLRNFSSKLTPSAVRAPVRVGLRIPGIVPTKK